MIMVVGMVMVMKSRWKATSGPDGSVYGTDCGDGFTVHTYLQTHYVAHVKYAQLSVCQSYLINVLTAELAIELV